MSEHPPFERLLSLADGLKPSSNESDREVLWCDDSGVVGLSRQSGGAIEIFLVGPQLAAQSSTVRRHLRHDKWSRSQGSAFSANRLVLPSADHFTASAAFVVEELFRANVLASLHDAFAKTEPIIEMLLRRTTLGEEVLLGLFGELTVLEAALSAASPSNGLATALAAWQGSEPSIRDFALPRYVAEVKTTRSASSVHHVHHLEQVNARRDQLTNGPLEQLYLISIGLFDADGASGRSLPELVEDILSRLGSKTGPRNALQLEFLQKLGRYATTYGVGYIHDEMRGWPAYQKSWSRSFVRIYDMNDEAIKVVRHLDVSARIHTALESIQFKIDLPAQVDGDINPQMDLLAFMTEAFMMDRFPGSPPDTR